MLMELVRGTVHLFYPYKSHTDVSGLAEGFHITDNINALTATALVTSQLGSVNLMLAFFLAIPLVFGDPTLSLSVYMLVVKLVIKVFAMLNLRFAWFTNVRDNIPPYLKRGYENWEGARKLPPGKLLHLVESVLLVVGVVAAVVERWRW